VSIYWDHVYQTDEVYLELRVFVGQPSIEEMNVLEEKLTRKQTRLQQLKSEFGT
jgi:hypothetical protein